MRKSIHALGVLGILVVVVSLTLGLFGCAKPAPAPAPAPAPTPAKVYTLKYAGYYPLGVPQGRDCDIFFMDRVKELSKGQIQFEYYPNQQMGKATDQLDIIGGGTADIGFIILPYFTGRDPLLGSLDLPFIYDIDLEGHLRLAMATVRQPDFAACLAKYNLQIVGGDSFGTISFFSKAPIKKMEDFKGKKIRSAGGMIASAVKALGAAAAMMASSEVYLALQTGVVDGSIITPESGLTLKFYEVSKYLAYPPISLAGNTMCKAVNMGVWKKLPKDLQDVMLKAGELTEKNELITMPQLERDALKELAQKGMEIYNVPREENLRWREACKPIWDEWLKENGDAGRRIYDFIIKGLEKK